MDNMTIFNQGRAVPPNAQKTIDAGRLKGMTDINPLWRLAKLTELFGPCGIGWKYIITRREMVSGANNEISCFVDVDLYYRWEGEWSEAVPGTGGSSYVASERNGLYTSDECYKMALTDALSVACKALGIGADVYWAAGRTKYTGNDEPPAKAPAPTPKAPAKAPAPAKATAPAEGKAIRCEDCGKLIQPVTLRDGTIWTAENIARYSAKRFGHTLCADCQKRVDDAEKRLAEQEKQENAGQ